jgi:hypothetical protein
MRPYKDSMRRTRDIGIEYVIFLDHIVYEFLALFVNYEYLPLQSLSDM